MAKLVVSGAVLECSQSMPPKAPGTFNTLPGPSRADLRPVGVSTDITPMMCVSSFGMCNSTSNPAVIAATAAALGVHTPAPCVPAPAGEWTKCSRSYKVDELPTITEDSTLQCMWNGKITVTSAGQSSSTSS